LKKVFINYFERDLDAIPLTLDDGKFTWNFMMNKNTFILLFIY